MHASKKAFCLAAVLLALTMLLACLSWLPMGGGTGSGRKRLTRSESRRRRRIRSHGRRLVRLHVDEF